MLHWKQWGWEELPLYIITWEREDTSMSHMQDSKTLKKLNMESGRAPCCCCYCKAATQAFFFSRKEVKDMTLHSQRDYLLYLLCFLFFFFSVLAGRNKFWISEFHCGDEDFISSFILFDTALLWLNEWNVGVQQSNKTGRYGVPGFFQKFQNQNRLKLKLTLKLTERLNQKRKTGPINCLAFFFH